MNKLTMLWLALLLIVAQPVNVVHVMEIIDSREFDVAWEVLSRPRYREVTMNVSAYTASSDECGKGDGITASGVAAVEGITVASDDLPFGTVVEIQGKSYVVQDRFGGGYTDRLDIFMGSVESAEDFGRQWITVKIKE